MRALVSSIHGSFATAATQQLEDALDRTNNNSPLLATTPSSPERQQQQQQQQHVEQSSRPVSPTDGREERVAADGAATTPRGITEPGGPAETTATSSPVAVAASVTATASSRSSTPTRLLHHRLRIPSLVVTSSLSPYHPGNLLAGVASTADPDHTQHRRFSFAIMRRHSNTVSSPLRYTATLRALAITIHFACLTLFNLASNQLVLGLNIILASSHNPHLPLLSLSLSPLTVPFLLRNWPCLFAINLPPRLESFSWFPLS